MPEYIRDSLQIGETIRKFRRQRNLTGSELGRRAGLSQSKISKIETGYYPNLQISEIQKIMNILNLPKTIRQQILAALELADTDNKFRLHAVPHWQGNAYEREGKAKTIRIFSSIIPALLQTMAYRKAILTNLSLGQEDLARYMNETVKRQDLLWDANRQYHFVFYESALFTSVTGRDGQLVQLDRIERFIGMPHIKIGIIPHEAGVVPIDHGPFVLYDDLLSVSIFSNFEAESRDPEGIVLDLRLFHELECLAAYDDEAIRLIRQAADYFK